MDDIKNELLRALNLNRDVFNKKTWLLCAVDAVNRLELKDTILRKGPDTMSPDYSIPAPWESPPADAAGVRFWQEFPCMVCAAPMDDVTPEVAAALQSVPAIPPAHTPAEIVEASMHLTGHQVRPDLLSATSARRPNT
ncbi:hypothetical protein Hamer_G003118 [Homarus americanus]|uniref:Uncharacterized protein n=1 Tax=Homarus americanus TaxID=6706 RepID=A0A8J5N6Y2_HOMAM|nr:hypothetical protein Hamer_G003118 [Homarus americanus]